MLRLLIVSVPNGPSFEIGEKISSFHDIPFFTLEFTPSEQDSYFLDKIPEITLDTNDKTSGSGSSQDIRDPKLLDKDKLLNSTSPYICDYQSISDDEYTVLSQTDQWICVSQIPDERLVSLANKVVFLNSSDNNAIDWFSKRRKCKCCGNVHHLEDKPSKISGICDRCGSDLIIMDCDKSDVVKRSFMKWRNSFWRLQNAAKEKGCYRTYGVDKFKSFDDLCSRINIDYRGFIVKKKSWYNVLDINDFGPDDFEIGDLLPEEL